MIGCAKLAAGSSRWRAFRDHGLAPRDGPEAFSLRGFLEASTNRASASTDRRFDPLRRGSIAGLRTLLRVCRVTSGTRRPRERGQEVVVGTTSIEGLRAARSALRGNLALNARPARSVSTTSRPRSHVRARHHGIRTTASASSDPARAAPPRAWPDTRHRIIAIADRPPTPPATASRGSGTCRRRRRRSTCQASRDDGFSTSSAINVGRRHRPDAGT